MDATRVSTVGAFSIRLELVDVFVKARTTSGREVVIVYRCRKGDFWEYMLNSLDVAAAESYMAEHGLSYGVPPTWASFYGDGSHIAAITGPRPTFLD